MKMLISNDELLAYVRAQANNFFPDKYDFCGGDVNAAFKIALERCEECFSVINHPGYHDECGNITFSHLHGDQYATFLYYFSNSLWKQSQNKVLCDKLLQLNRTLFTLFISYKNDMPDHFFLGHPFGTILGNAVYNDFLVVSQGVTVNTSADENGNPAPVLGKGVFLGTGARIIGNMPVGDRVSIGVDALVYNMAIMDDSVVIHKDGNPCMIMKRKKPKCQAQSFFNVEI